MKFFKAIVGLLALVNATSDTNATSIYEADTLTSDKVNITITATP